MRTAVVDLHEHEIIAVGQDDVPTAVEIRAERADAEAIAGAVDRALEAAGRAEARSVELRLHPPLVQLRTLSGIPPVRERDLEALVLNQHTRFFRPPLGEPVVSATWRRSDEEPVAIAALAERELLERLTTAVRVGGRTVRHIVPCDEVTHSSMPLRTPEMRARERARLVRHLALAAFVAVSGWILAGATYLFDLYRDDRAIDAQLEAFEEPLGRIQSLEGTLTAFAPVATAYRRQSPGSSWLIPRLQGIAQSLPKDAHLHRLVAGRGAPTVLEVHGPAPVAVVEQLGKLWPGVVRLEGVGDAVDYDSVGGLFTVILEEGL
jgi:hypothetical protein